MTSKTLYRFALLCLIVILSSCSSNKSAVSLANLEKSTCYTQSDYHYTVDDLPKVLNINNIDSNLQKNFSLASLNMANAIQILDVIEYYNRLKTEYLSGRSIEKKIALMEVQQSIIQRINISSLEISSVASELDCEEERIKQIFTFLKNKADNRERNLVIASIVVGSVGAISTEILNNTYSNGKPGSFVSVGSAIIEAGLGVLILTNKSKINFYHKRNSLGEVWNGLPTSKTLPPAIWYYLNYSNNTYREKSLRGLLVENWQNYGQVSKKGKNSIDIYFGEGGGYSAEELKNRADMYDQLEAYISLMKQDLKLLSIEFEKFCAKD